MLLVNAIAGIGIIFVGIWILIKSLKNDSLAAGVAGLIVAVFAIMMGIVFIGDIKAFEFFTFIALYVVGFFIALAGVESLISGKGLKAKGYWCFRHYYWNLICCNRHICRQSTGISSINRCFLNNSRNN